jgi:hypothetical protein
LANPSLYRFAVVRQRFFRDGLRTGDEMAKLDGKRQAAERLGVARIAAATTESAA